MQLIAMPDPVGVLCQCAARLPEAMRDAGMRRETRESKTKSAAGAAFDPPGSRAEKRAIERDRQQYLIIIIEFYFGFVSRQREEKKSRLTAVCKRPAGPAAEPPRAHARASAARYAGFLQSQVTLRCTCDRRGRGALSAGLQTAT